MNISSHQTRSQDHKSKSPNNSTKKLPIKITSGRSSYYQLDINYNPHTEHLKLKLLPVDLEKKKESKKLKDKSSKIPSIGDGIIKKTLTGNTELLSHSKTKVDIIRGENKFLIKTNLSPREIFRWNRKCLEAQIKRTDLKKSHSLTNVRRRKHKLKCKRERSLEQIKHRSTVTEDKRKFESVKEQKKNDESKTKTKLRGAFTTTSYDKNFNQKLSCDKNFVDTVAMDRKNCKGDLKDAVKHKKSSKTEKSSKKIKITNELKMITSLTKLFEKETSKISKKSPATDVIQTLSDIQITSKKFIANVMKDDDTEIYFILVDKTKQKFDPKKQLPLNCIKYSKEADKKENKTKTKAKSEKCSKSGKNDSEKEKQLPQNSSFVKKLMEAVRTSIDKQCEKKTDENQSKNDYIEPEIAQVPVREKTKTHTKKNKPENLHTLNNSKKEKEQSVKNKCKNKTKMQNDTKERKIICECTVDLNKESPRKEKVLKTTESPKISHRVKHKTERTSVPEETPAKETSKCIVKDVIKDFKTKEDTRRKHVDGQVKEKKRYNSPASGMTEEIQNKKSEDSNKQSEHITRSKQQEKLSIDKKSIERNKHLEKDRFTSKENLPKVRKEKSSKSDKKSDHMRSPSRLQTNILLPPENKRKSNASNIPLRNPNHSNKSFKNSILPENKHHEEQNKILQKKHMKTKQTTNNSTGVNEMQKKHFEHSKQHYQKSNNIETSQKTSNNYEQNKKSLRREVSFSQLHLDPVKDFYATPSRMLDIQQISMNVQSMDRCHKNIQKKEKSRKKRTYYKSIEKKTVLSEVITKKEKNMYSDQSDLVTFYAKTKRKRPRTNHFTRKLICTENVVETSVKASDGNDESSTLGFVVEGIEPPKRLGFPNQEVENARKVDKIKNLHKTVFSVMEIESTTPCTMTTTTMLATTTSTDSGTECLKKENKKKTTEISKVVTEIYSYNGKNIIPKEIKNDGGRTSTKFNVLKDLDLIIEECRRLPKGLHKFSINKDSSQPQYSSDVDSVLVFNGDNQIKTTDKEKSKEQVKESKSLSFLGFCNGDGENNSIFLEDIEKFEVQSSLPKLITFKEIACGKNECFRINRRGIPTKRRRCVYKCSPQIMSKTKIIPVCKSKKSFISSHHKKIDQKVKKTTNNKQCVLTINSLEKQTPSEKHLKEYEKNLSFCSIHVESHSQLFYPIKPLVKSSINLNDFIATLRDENQNINELEINLDKLLRAESSKSSSGSKDKKRPKTGTQIPRRKKDDEKKTEIKSLDLSMKNNYQVMYTFKENEKTCKNQSSFLLTKNYKENSRLFAHQKRKLYGETLRLANKNNSDDNRRSADKLAIDKLFLQAKMPETSSNDNQPSLLKMFNYSVQSTVNTVNHNYSADASILQNSLVKDSKKEEDKKNLMEQQNDSTLQPVCGRRNTLTPASMLPCLMLHKTPSEILGKVEKKLKEHELLKTVKRKLESLNELQSKPSKIARNDAFSVCPFIGNSSTSNSSSMNSTKPYEILKTGVSKHTQCSFSTDSLEYFSNKQTFNCSQKLQKRQCRSSYSTSKLCKYTSQHIPHTTGVKFFIYNSLVRFNDDTKNSDGKAFVSNSTDVEINEEVTDQEPIHTPISDESGYASSKGNKKKSMAKLFKKHSISVLDMFRNKKRKSEGLMTQSNSSTTQAELTNDYLASNVFKDEVKDSPQPSIKIIKQPSYSLVDLSESVMDINFSQSQVVPKKSKNLLSILVNRKKSSSKNIEENKQKSEHALKQKLSAFFAGKKNHNVQEKQVEHLPAKLFHEYMLNLPSTSEKLSSENTEKMAKEILTYQENFDKNSVGVSCSFGSNHMLKDHSSGISDTFSIEFQNFPLKTETIQQTFPIDTPILKKDRKVSTIPQEETTQTSKLPVNFQLPIAKTSNISCQTVKENDGNQSPLAVTIGAQTSLECSCLLNPPKNAKTTESTSTEYENYAEQVREETKQRQLGHLKQFTDFCQKTNGEQTCPPPKRETFCKCSSSQHKNIEFYQKKICECHEYAQKVRLEMELRKEGHPKRNSTYKEIPLNVLLGKDKFQDKKVLKTKEVAPSIGVQVQMKESYVSIPLEHVLKPENYDNKEVVETNMANEISCMKLNLETGNIKVKLKKNDNQKFKDDDEVRNFEENTLKDRSRIQNEQTELKEYQNEEGVEKVEEEMGCLCLDDDSELNKNAFEKVEEVTTSKLPEKNKQKIMSNTTIPSMESSVEISSEQAKDSLETIRSSLTERELFDTILNSYEKEDEIAKKLSNDDDFFEKQLISVKSKESVEKFFNEKKTEEESNIHKIHEHDSKTGFKKLSKFFKRDSSLKEIVGPREENRSSVDQNSILSSSIDENDDLMQKVTFSKKSEPTNNEPSILGSDSLDISQNVVVERKASIITRSDKVQPSEIGKCFRRGFRPDNLTLAGKPCFELDDKEKQNRLLSHTSLNVNESFIDFSERETPLEYLLALGFSVDEASNAIKDEDVRNRLYAAITEARIWINHINTTQGTLLYLLSFKAKPKVMRYFLQLVEAIINKRITNAVKLDGFLRLLEKIEDGDVSMVTILGINKLEDEQNEEKIVKNQLKKLFINVYNVANGEAAKKNIELSKNAINLLRILAAKYRAGLHPHLELIARYIGQGLLDNEIQLEAAMIYLSRLDTANVKLKEFEKYCSIQC